MLWRIAVFEQSQGLVIIWVRVPFVYQGLAQTLTASKPTLPPISSPWSADMAAATSLHSVVLDKAKCPPRPSLRRQSVLSQHPQQAVQVQR